MIGIASALSSELKPFLNILENKTQKEIMGYIFYSGTINNHSVVLAQSGIGKMNASSLITLMIEHYDVDLIINSGIAGGFDKNLKTLDSVQAVRVGCYDINMMLDNLPYGCLEEENRFIESNVKCSGVISGLIMTADTFAGNRKALEDVFDKYYSNEVVYAVDMESYAVAYVCKKYNVEWVVIRSISDVVGQTNQLEAYYNFPLEASKRSFDIIMKNFFN